MPGDSSAMETAASQPGTRAWSSPMSQTLVPSLGEVLPTGLGQQFSLTFPEYWIGRDSQNCRIARPDDPLVNARHARLHRDADGEWHIDNNKSLNGLWLRVWDPMPIEKVCQFRMGEQRFIFRVK